MVDLTEAKVHTLKPCDICKALEVKVVKVAMYDGKTTFGQWAYMCPPHFTRYGVGLGTGKGQRLVLANQ